MPGGARGVLSREAVLSWGWATMAVRVIAKDRHHALQQAQGAARAEQLDRVYANQREALLYGTASLQQRPDVDHHLDILRLGGPLLSEQEIAEYDDYLEVKGAASSMTYQSRRSFCPRKYAKSRIVYDPLSPPWEKTPRFASEVKPVWDLVHPWFGEYIMR